MRADWTLENPGKRCILHGLNLVSHKLISRRSNLVHAIWDWATKVILDSLILLGFFWRICLDQNFPVDLASHYWLKSHFQNSPWNNFTNTESRTTWKQRTVVDCTNWSSQELGWCRSKHWLLAFGNHLPTSNQARLKLDFLQISCVPLSLPLGLLGRGVLPLAF